MSKVVRALKSEFWGLVLLTQHDTVSSPLGTPFFQLLASDQHTNLAHLGTFFFLTVLTKNCLFLGEH